MQTFISGAMSQDLRAIEKPLLEAKELRKSYHRGGGVFFCRKQVEHAAHPYTRELLAAVPELLRA